MTTLSDVLPAILAHLKVLLAANITPAAQPPAALKEHGLLDDEGKLTTKGRAVLVRIYPLAEVLDVPVA